MFIYGKDTFSCISLSAIWQTFRSIWPIDGVVIRKISIKFYPIYRHHFIWHVAGFIILLVQQKNISMNIYFLVILNSWRGQWSFKECSYLKRWKVLIKLCKRNLKTSKTVSVGLVYCFRNTSIIRSHNCCSTSHQIRYVVARNHLD